MITGCSGAPETPTDTTSAPPSSGSDDSSGAPKVPNPLNTAKYEQNPCGMVPQAKAAALSGAVTAKMDEATAGGSVGASCFWSDSAADGVHIGFGHAGVDKVYLDNKALARPYFTPVNVGGYPGVFTDVADRRAKGVCNMTLGTADDRIIVIGSSFSARSPFLADPCAVVQKYAEAAITTMRGGA
nr:DUF3558 domain-containing protein [Amycolatopsis sp. CA-230715]